MTAHEEDGTYLLGLAGEALLGAFLLGEPLPTALNMLERLRPRCWSCRGGGAAGCGDGTRDSGEGGRAQERLWEAPPRGDGAA